MIQAILFILKIILWIVLAVLGLLLVLILLVLFSPIRYKIDAKYNTTAKIMAKISFLIFSVRLDFNQEIKKLDYVIRVAGIRLKLGKKKPDKTNQSAKNENNSDSQIMAEKDDAAEFNASNVDDGEVTVNEIDTIGNDNQEVDITEADDALLYEEFDLWDNDIEKDIPKEHISILGRIKALIVGIKNKLKLIKEGIEEFDSEKIVSGIEAKLDKLKKNIDNIKKFWNLKCTVKSRNYIKKYLLGLIKHVGPRKIKGYVRYGFGDPCKTGQITGYLSLLPFVYNKDFFLQPDFYNKVVEADVLLKGRIRIGYIARIVLNINIWRTITVARKIFKGRK